MTVKLFELSHYDESLFPTMHEVFSDSAYYAQLSKETDIDVWVEKEIDELPVNCSLENKHYFFVMLDGETIGFTQVFSNYHHPSASQGTATISLFLIKEKYQGRGFGRKFYSLLEKHLSMNLRTDKFRLGVMRENLKAKAYWEKQGFTLIETRDNLFVFEK